MKTTNVVKLYFHIRNVKSFKILSIYVIEPKHINTVGRLFSYH
jgi:hypothetical protein